MTMPTERQNQLARIILVDEMAQVYEERNGKEPDREKREQRTAEVATQNNIPVEELTEALVILSKEAIALLIKRKRK